MAFSNISRHMKWLVSLHNNIISKVHKTFWQHRDVSRFCSFFLYFQVRDLVAKMARHFTLARSRRYRSTDPLSLKLKLISHRVLSEQAGGRPAALLNPEGLYSHRHYSTSATLRGIRQGERTKSQKGHSGHFSRKTRDEMLSGCSLMLDFVMRPPAIKYFLLTV